METLETFETGTRCPWTQHIFGDNERGMKCLRCERVLKLSAWQEKQRCFCGSTSFVEAVARRPTPNPIQRTTLPQNSPTVPSNPPVSRPPRTTTPSSQGTPSTIPPRSTPSSSDRSGWGCLALLSLFVFFLFIVTGFSIYISLFSQQFRTRTNQPQRSTKPQSHPAQNYPDWKFPRSECGDSNPPGLQDFYPVYVNRTDSNTLNYIKNKYCRDADLITRKPVNRQSIQVASFRSKKRAIEFSQIMLQDPSINSAEVGSPSQR
jgi:hypothetical protein